MLHGLLSITAMLLPRVFILVLWQVSSGFRDVFGNTVWPVTGCIFAPYATLAYAAAIYNNGSTDGNWIVLVIVGAVIDGFHWAGIARHGWTIKRLIART